jgi:CDGSH-type Zn-finger protein
MPIQNKPYVVQETPGRKAWCACGESEKQPYCDGSHARKNTGKTPVIVEIEKAGTAAYCGCRQSAKKPFCDGTHSRLK